MAAPAGSGAVEAYKNTKVRGATPAVAVKDFVPKASDSLMDETARRSFAAANNMIDAAKHPPRPPPRELPPGTYGGRKKTRRHRRGGAMSKTIRELKADLERDPTESTLRNVLSDFKGADDNPRLRDYGQEYEDRLEDPLRAGETRADRVRMIIERVVGLLRMYGRGRRRKTTRRR
jgi:hypothetical protein